MKEGRIPKDWKARPARLRQKDRDARWTVKFSKAIDRNYDLIRKWQGTGAAAYEGARLREGLLDKSNTASSVWADTAYRSKANEAFMEANGFVSKVHRKKPKGKPMSEAVRRGNITRSKVRSCVEHVFAAQKDRMGLFVCTIGIARATPRRKRNQRQWSANDRRRRRGGNSRSDRQEDARRAGK